MPASYQFCLWLGIDKLDTLLDFFRSLFSRAASAL